MRPTADPTACSCARPNFLEHCTGCRFINMKETKLQHRSRFTQLAGTLRRMQIHKHVTTRPHRSKQFQKSEFMGCIRTRKASGCHSRARRKLDPRKIASCVCIIRCATMPYTWIPDQNVAWLHMHQALACFDAEI